MNKYVISLGIVVVGALVATSVFFGLKHLNPAPASAPAVVPAPTSTPVSASGESPYKLFVRFESDPDCLNCDESSQTMNIYFAKDQGPEQLVYSGGYSQDLNSNPPDSNDFKDTPILMYSSSSAASAKFAFDRWYPEYKDDKIVGARISLSGYGDAGVSSMSRLYIPFEDPESTFSVSKITDGNNPEPYLYVWSRETGSYEVGPWPIHPKCSRSDNTGRYGTIAESDIYIGVTDKSFHRSYLMKIPNPHGAKCVYGGDIIIGLDTRLGSVERVGYLDDIEYEVSLAPEPQISIKFLNHRFGFNPTKPYWAWSL